MITVRNVDNGALIGAGSSTNSQAVVPHGADRQPADFRERAQAYVASIALGLKTEVAVRQFPQNFITQVANLVGALDPVTRTMFTEVR